MGRAASRISSLVQAIQLAQKTHSAFIRKRNVKPILLFRDPDVLDCGTDRKRSFLNP